MPDPNTMTCIQCGLVKASKSHLLAHLAHLLTRKPLALRVVSHWCQNSQHSVTLETLATNKVTDVEGDPLRTDKNKNSLHQSTGTISLCYNNIITIFFPCTKILCSKRCMKEALFMYDKQSILGPGISSKKNSPPTLGFSVMLSYIS